MTIFDIQRFSLHDGPGIRTTIFLKGCPMRCLWCQNPEGLSFDIDTNMPYKLKSNCRKVEPEELAEEAMADRVFFEVSGGGVTFSGGEALSQVDAVCQTADILRSKGIHTAIETTLCTSRESVQKAIDSIDLILADLKIFDSQAHKAATSNGNEQILDNFRFAAKQLAGTGRLIARTPLIPHYTADTDNLTAIADFIFSVDPDISWELLNFNPLPSAKYQQMGNHDFDIFAGLKAFSELQMQEFRSIALARGLNKNQNSNKEVSQ